MPKTKCTPSYSNSSSSSSDNDSDGSSNYKDSDIDIDSDEEEEDEEISANPHHRVYKDVNELKEGGEWESGRGHLLGGIVRDGKANATAETFGFIASRAMFF